MKIGIYCTNNHPYPVPPGNIYASITVAGNLTDELTNMGHDVTLFAPIGTRTKAKLETFDMLPFSNEQIHQKFPDAGSSYEYENIMLAQALNFAEQNNFDLFHAHCRPFSIAAFAALKPKLPIVATVHDPLTSDAYLILPEYNRFKNLHFVSLSKNQQTTCPNLSWSGFVFNGVDTKKFTFNPNPQDYWLFTSRIMPEKGADIAVSVARKTGLPLKICGSIYPHHQPFFDEKIAPFLNDKIQYLGTVSQENIIDLYANAKALLDPIRWPEPFGLVVTESMSCGTPVIAFPNGSMPELIDNGKNGFLVSTEEEMIEAVGKIDQIDRQFCRQTVEEKFGLKSMATNYLNVYQKILS